jgi:hypothetical protein
MSKDTKFKKGRSGNPGGRPKLPPDVREAKNLTQQQLILILNKLMFMTDFEIKQLLNDPKTNKFERIVGRILDKADLHGDSVRLEFLLNRTIGKVTEKVQHTLPRPVIIKRLDGTEVIMKAELPEPEEVESGQES